MQQNQRNITERKLDVMDYKDVIVHIFCREDRLFYDLERIWRDGKTFVDVNEL